MSRTALLALLTLTALAFALRVYDLGDIPGGFYCDEAANGYNAHTLFEHGVDEHGKPYPLFVWSFLAFKYPLYIYPTAVWTGILGLSEFSTRLQAAVYGAATIPVAFAIARYFAGGAAGLAAALLLTILPWHQHFGRIAFSLSGLPFWFGLGFLYLLRALGEHARRRDWILAGLFFALTPYCYAPGQLVVAPFVGLALFLHADVVWRRRKQAWLGLLTIVVVSAPFVYFFWSNLELQTRYAEMISVFTPNRSTAQIVERIGHNYTAHYAPRFLFERGDTIIRHGVRTTGMLYWAMAPWIAIGILGALVKRDRKPKLLLLWLALYPLGAILIRESPSGTRAITGALLFPLLAGIGFGYTIRALRSIRFKSLGVAGSTAATVTTLVFLAPEASSYLHHYFTEYASYSAAGIYGFQYGWRDLFRYMEPRRASVDSFRISSTDLNQGYIFRLFYVHRSPQDIARWGPPRTDYKFVQPRNIARWYDPNKTLLFAIQDIDLWVIDSWDEEHDVIAPGGYPAFHVLRNPKPKRFLERWEVNGPFPNPANKERGTNFLDPVASSRPDALHQGWKPIAAPNGFLQLNSAMGARMTPPTRNAEFAIAYLRASVDAAADDHRDLEIYGSGDEVMVWVNGRRIGGDRIVVTPNRASLIPVDLSRGSNTILIKAIETVGPWWLAARTKPEAR